METYQSRKLNGRISGRNVHALGSVPSGERFREIIFRYMPETRNRIETIRNYQQDVDTVFRYPRAVPGPLSEIAGEISAEIRHLSVFIEQHTAVVCPDCDSVCCINRHSRHALDDVVYLAARGALFPPSTAGLNDSAPCQFLGKGGCRISREVRPYRCTWYFCSPLLDHIVEHNSSRQYRSFINLLERITRKRQRMMEEYYALKSTLLPG